VLLGDVGEWGYEGVPNYEGFEHQYLKSAPEQTKQAHRQNLVAKPTNLYK
jgi:hypothetical protein